MSTAVGYRVLHFERLYCTNPLGTRATLDCAHSAAAGPNREMAGLATFEPSAQTPLTWSLALFSSFVAGLYVTFAIYRSFGKGAKKLPPGPLLHVPLLGDGVLMAAGNPVKMFWDR